MKKYLSIVGIVILFSFVSTLVLAKQESPPLTGGIASEIVKKFAAYHYSHDQPNDNISEKTLNIFLNRLDPSHLYFLDSDIQEFMKFKYRIDDYFRQNNVELALHIFTRFKTRLSERLELLEAFQEDTFDFEVDGKWLKDREEAPYPQTIKEAQQLARLRFKFDLLTLTLGGNSVEEAKERLITRAKSRWKDISKYTDNDVVALYLNALTSAYDPHSTYMAPHDRDNFEINIKLSLEGIGAVLRWENGYTVVNSIVPGGAAFREGNLKVNDRIIAVAQAEQPFENVVDMRLNEVVQLIRGKRGTQVRIQIMRKSTGGDEFRTISIIREKIVLKDGESKAYILTPDMDYQDDSFQGPQKSKIGLIHLPSFYTDFEGRRKNPLDFKSASRDVKKHLHEFAQEGVDGVIIDLRGNGGGGLDEAINMAGQFVGKKPVVAIRDFRGNIDVRRSFQEKIYDGPLLVLLDHYSASASEILAGALQDYGRAILVGDKTTFGKGSVQNITSLSHYGALKVTVAQFYRVAGGSTQNKGVEPDIVLPSLNNHWEVGEAYLENALPWQKINSLNYTQDPKIPELVPQLTSLSQKRVATNEGFQKVQNNIEEYLTKIKPEKYTSISKIKSEFEKSEAEKEARKAEIDAKLANAEIVDDAIKAATPSEDVVADNTFEYAGKNIYLDESIHILEDYIQFLKSDKAAISKN